MVINFSCNMYRVATQTRELNFLLRNFYLTLEGIHQQTECTINIVFENTKIFQAQMT